MKQLLIGATTWMTEQKKDSIPPAHRGWAPYVLKAMAGQTDPFLCPSNKNAIPTSTVFVSQTRPGFTYPMLATDSAYFQHSPTPESDGFYKASMETEADMAGGDQDFDDAYVYTRPPSGASKMAEVYAVKSGTGRSLTLHDWRGRTLVQDFATTPRFQQPVLWGSYAMNLSAAIPGIKPQHILYLEYTDWAAVVETRLGVRSVDGHLRGDGPRRKEWVAAQHNKRANVAFFDTHVERILPRNVEPPADESVASKWHPWRPPGWVPPQLSSD